MRKIITCSVLAVALLTAGITIGHVTTHPKTLVNTQDDVSSFNDGWNTALYGDGK